MNLKSTFPHRALDRMFVVLLSVVAMLPAAVWVTTSYVRSEPVSTSANAPDIRCTEDQYREYERLGYHAYECDRDLEWEADVTP